MLWIETKMYYFLSTLFNQSKTWWHSLFEFKKTFFFIAILTTLSLPFSHLQPSNDNVTKNSHNNKLLFRSTTEILRVNSTYSPFCTLSQDSLGFIFPTQLNLFPVCSCRIKWSSTYTHAPTITRSREKAIFSTTIITTLSIRHTLDKPPTGYYIS